MVAKHTLFASLLALAVLALPSVGAAQDTGAQARQLFEQGVAAMEGGNPALASQYFNQSYQLYPRASTACNMALSLERTQRTCEAQQWYRQCAALDQEGRFRDHANRQASALAAQCQSSGAQPANPFVSGPSNTGTVTASGHVQVVETGNPQPQVHLRHRGADHTLLGVGIGGLVLGAGALGGAIGLALAADDEVRQLALLVPRPAEGSPPAQLTPGSEAADHYDRARGFSTGAIALYVVSGVLAGVSVILIAVDLAQPGAFGGEASSEPSLRLAVSPTVGGALGQLDLRF